MKGIYMRIKFDDVNKVVIAEGYVKGRRVKAIAVCAPDDAYDKKFGEQLALAKYSYKETLTKIKCHESNIKSMKQEIASLMACIADEERIISSLDEKLNKTNEVANEIINAHYSK